MRKLGMFWIAGLVAVITASSAMAISLVQIPPIGADTATSGRTVTANGIVVGQSGTATGLIWDSTNGTRTIISSDNAQATVASGVGYRTVNGQPQLVVHGLSAGYSTNWFSNDNGLTWGPRLRDTATGTPVIGTTGTMRTNPSSDVFYDTWHYTTATGGAYLYQASGEPATWIQSYKGVTTRTEMKSVSATGLAVGMRRDAAGQNQNYKMQWNGTATPTATYFKTLNGANANASLQYYGQAWAVNDLGTKIFGMSPVIDGRAGNWPYMYDVATDTAVELPTYANTAGSTTNALAYSSSQSGEFAGGMDYRGTEKAVLWHTTIGAITDLTRYFTDLGLMGNFSRLSRVYGVAEDGSGGLWLTGQGVWSSDGGVTNLTRGFVINMPIPEPATGILLALAGAFMLRRRR